MLVYRSSTRSVSCATLLRELLASLDLRDDGTEALLRAGELECALADQKHSALGLACKLSDALAARCLGAPEPTPLELVRALSTMELPDLLTLKVPEGYAYYALTPQSYAELAQGFAGSQALAVIGVRSIGTSLSAIVCQALRARAMPCERMTVRCGGHPWDRTLTLTGPEVAFVDAQVRAGASFIVVDEGPGMSGSTLLAVAAALEARGVGAQHIHFFCSHEPDLSRLVAPHAAERWRRYRSWATRPLQPPAASVDYSCGAWREHEYADVSEWPASWTQNERVKWLCETNRTLEKFEGMPPYGLAPIARAQTLAEAGFGPSVQRSHDGLARFAFLQGRPASPADASPLLLTHLARYCAFRVRAFPAAESDVAGLEQMLRINVQESLGRPWLGRPLELHAPVICDARMLPHEWRIDERGRFFKTDGHGHGDDHLLPGPSDICWDLAGVILEWALSPAHCELFLQEYQRLSGDIGVRERLSGYLCAYSAQRCGQLDMAKHSADAREQQRLAAASHAQRAQLERLLSAEL